MKEVERSVAEIQRGEIEKGDCDEWDREHFLGEYLLFYKQAFLINFKSRLGIGNEAIKQK